MSEKERCVFDGSTKSFVRLRQATVGRCDNESAQLADPTEEIEITSRGLPEANEHMRFNRSLECVHEICLGGGKG